MVRRVLRLALVLGLPIAAACGGHSSIPLDDAATDPIDGAVADTTPTPTPDASPDAQPDTASDTAKTDTAVSPPDATPHGVPFIILGGITGATTAEEPMIKDGIALANQTMATTCFRDYVLKASWTETNGLTQQQIWDQLCSGPISVVVDMYMGSWYQNNVSKTIGYEDTPGIVHMNRYFVDTAYMVADNVIHEAEGHSQGFRHDGVKSTSVPYGLNAAFEKCSPVGP
jgi:hypothetical protein